MADWAEFHVAVPLRCYSAVEGPSGWSICGAPATFQFDPGAPAGGFFCERHRPKCATAIAPDALIRRVSLVVEVVFAGVSWSPSVAKNEAVARLQQAVEDVGGVLNLVTATSTVGRFSAPPPAGGAHGNGDKGQ